MGERIRSMMYIQQLSHWPFQSIEELENAIKNLGPCPERYGIIIHDHDKNAETGKIVEPHVHAFMHFENPRSINEVAKLLGDKPERIENMEKDGHIHNPVESGFSYLCHRTPSSRDKYQYDLKDVKANFDYVEYMAKLEKKYNNKMTAEAIGVLLDDLYKGIITKEDIENRLTGSQYAKYKRSIDDINAKYLERHAKEWRASMLKQGKHIQVIWIYGKAGVGKTRLAKHRAMQEGDYYMSGSSRDIFQNYTGQHTVILDELRPRSISYGDLLRILDPFGLDANVMAPSRYNDKALAADLFIITTPYDPIAFYCQSMPYSNDNENNPDSFDQLLRRITLTIMIDEKKIYQMQYDSTNKKYVKMNDGHENIYFENSDVSLKINSESTDLFDSMFEWKN